MIAIIQYNAGNTTSVHHAIQRLGFDAVVTDQEATIRAAEKVIFPGVGEASSAMRYLSDRGLDQVMCSLTQPVLGICLGQQLLCRYSEEGDVACLGIFDVAVKKFPPLGRVPHVGWNNLTDTKGPLLQGVSEMDDVYFVHSYYAECCEHTLAVCNYLVPFSASMQHRNFYATQFHPEKSAGVGEIILSNFLNL
jgi:imidazole glycerol-phosphate synthase subunit HisH